MVGDECTLFDDGEALGSADAGERHRVGNVDRSFVAEEHAIGAGIIVLSVMALSPRDGLAER